MARETYVFDEATGEVIPKRDYVRSQPASARSHLPRPMLMSDAIAGGISQVSGKYHDTKSGLMRDYADYEARTGEKLHIVGDQTHHLQADFDLSRPMADERAIEATIKQTLEGYGA